MVVLEQLTFLLFLKMADEQAKAPYTCLTKRDKVNLDIFWLKDDALEESANLPAPEIIAQEITDDLEAALEQFATIAEDLKAGPPGRG